MATGGFKANAATDFLEEWKAKREKMRAKMLGDIAAATGAPYPVSREEPGSNLKKDCEQEDKKERKSSGPSARKGQIEKRKLREKRRSTGVVSIPSNESLDELDDEESGDKERREEEELVQANTFQNEAMTAEPASGSLPENPRSEGGRHKSSAGHVGEEEVAGNSRQRHSRHAGPGNLEKRLEELEMELARERQDNAKLLKAHQEKDEMIEKMKEEIDLLNRELDDIEDENEQLKQENKTLLKVVGQLTR